MSEQLHYALIKITILEETSCCGASHLEDFDEFLAHVLNARNICNYFNNKSFLNYPQIKE